MSRAKESNSGERTSVGSSRIATATWTSAVKIAYQEQQDAKELPE